MADCGSFNVVRTSLSAFDLRFESVPGMNWHAPKNGMRNTTILLISPILRHYDLSHFDELATLLVIRAKPYLNYVGWQSVGIVVEKVARSCAELRSKAP